jgi:plasmid maintenance system killer protein
VWNGTGYVYVADVSSRGYLGYLHYINEEGWPVYWRNYPWDYVKLDKSQVQPRNGYYDLIINERYDEIFYLDAAYMLVVDHPSNVNVYTTMGEQYIDQNFMGKIYTIGKNLLTPLSAFNERGADLLSQISKLDGIYTSANNGIYSASIDNIEWNRLTLNLGSLSDAKQIKLVINGILDWGPDEDQGKWYERFFTQSVPNGTQPIPHPYMEVKDASGNWVRVPESRQFPLLPDSKPRTIVVDLTGLFPTNDYSLRINNFWNVTFDYIGVDTTPQENLSIQRISLAYASLNQAFNANSDSSGSFTRYGDITQLLLNADDKFVIGRQGDRVSFQFPIANIAPLADGMERDFSLINALWFKESGNPGVEFTVDPLPFQNMSGFPYPSTENYPSDEDHSSYLLEYNTRVLPVLRSQWIVGDILKGTIVTGIGIAGMLIILTAIKERARRTKLPRVKSTLRR